MERLNMFLPSILAIAGIAIVAWVYIKLILKSYGNNIYSVEWIKKNMLKLSFTVATPVFNVFAPALEELVFRAPLIILFDQLTPTAWIAIAFSSVIFGLVHWSGHKLTIQDVLQAQRIRGNKSDDIRVEIEAIGSGHKAMILSRKVFNIVSTIPVGVLAGYFGIKYQSIWLAFGIHAAWNFIMPAIIPIINVITIIVSMGIVWLLDKITSCLFRK